MKLIKKNNEILLVDMLENGYDDLNIGDKYITLSDENTLVSKYNYSGRISNMVAKVIWYYNVGDKKKVICRYDKTMEEMIRMNKAYLSTGV